MSVTIRFDDVHCGCDFQVLREMTAIAQQHGAEVWWGISPLWDSLSEGERVFPRRLGAMSDHRLFYDVSAAGVPCGEVPSGVVTASHGLVHVDHRLLGREAQEMSILVSCNLVGTDIFVPPFNKWNENTEDVCAEHNIELVKFEDGWHSMEHCKPGATFGGRWYLHHRRFGVERFRAWF